MLSLIRPTQLFCLSLLVLCFSCSTDTKVKEAPASLFTSLPTSKTQINFRNSVTESQEFNFINYLNIYNGGGLAIGDINNDGLQDVYMCANQGDNKMYLNQGDMVFKDITDKANLKGSRGWTTGVSMVDINNDGLLDIYVCKSGSVRNPNARKNQLFINKGKNQFEDQATKYGLDDTGFSTQAYFLDYDKDDDIDMFLVGHRVDFDNTIRLSAEISQNFIPEFSDRLFRNDNGTFTDVSREAGILNKTWGHSAAIYDYNEDGYLDIFLCNDFLEPDMLWINNKKGGFSNKAVEKLDHISMYSMGSDVADINNDGRADLMVLDMVSEDHMRSKRNMPGMSTEQFNSLVDLNYHHQYMANMLQLNMGQGRFAEIAHLAGVSKTDWSWAPLLADFDNDGYRDIYITNGIKRDMTDNDYKNELTKRTADGSAISLDEIFQMAPSAKQQNYFYHNNGNTTFTNKSTEWGMPEKLFSNGAAYADLDNDGDLDLVVNNLEDFASVYQNNSVNNYLRLTFEGSDKNKMGLGTEVKIYNGSEEIYYQHFLNRGYQSSVGSVATIGLGNKAKIEKMVVKWPDGKMQILTDVKANKEITLQHKSAGQMSDQVQDAQQYVQRIGGDELPYSHEENAYNDFSTEILLPYKMSTMGPEVTSGDVNNDGRVDFYLSGANNQAGSLLIDQGGNNYSVSNVGLWEADKSYEDMGSLFFDCDGDGDLDLYVVSGSNEQRGASKFQDRLYLNDGNGVFTKSSNRLPKISISGSVVTASDYDKDGDMDLFIGGRVVPGKYPLPASSLLLENNKGSFKEVSTTAAPELKEIGMVTDAQFSDYDADGDMDIIIVGEWMPLVIMENKKGKFVKKELEEKSGRGWFYHVNAIDLDGDGDDDYILGNLGLNNKFGAKEDKPFHVYCDDFDDTGNLDIVLGKESKGKLLPVRGRECSSQQMPFIKEKFPTFKSFAQADLEKIYGDLSDALHYKATTFESMVLMNDGPLGLRKVSLPIEAQYGPTLSSVVLDVNGDGHLDIIGAGNIYNTEVETIRYDGSKGYILLGKEDGSFIAAHDTGFYVDGNVKDMVLYESAGEKHLLVVKNNGPTQRFKLIQKS